MSNIDFDVLKTNNLKMQETLKFAHQVAQTQASVVIVGEPGTGKTNLAQYIHSQSKRAQLILVDCKLEQSLPNEFPAGATLLIEDIDSSSLAFQTELLRLTEKINTAKVRIIATSRKDLRLLVKVDQFRQDLFYKIAVVFLEVPKLEERKMDLASLCEFILSVNQIIHGKQNIRLSAEAFGRIHSWRWPGNIRELENVLERAVLLAKGPVIEESQIIFESLATELVSDFAPGMSLFEVEKRLIIQTLELTAQNRTRAAHILGISIRTLRNKLNEYKNEFQGEMLNEQRSI